MRGRPRSKPGDPPTEKQLRFYRWVFEYTQKNGHQPTMTEIVKALGMKSVGSAAYNIRVLSKKGYVAAPGKNSRSRFRAIRFLKRPNGDPFKGFH